MIPAQLLFLNSLLFCRKIGGFQNILAEPLVAAGGGEHTAHEVVAAVGVGKGVEGVVWVHAEFFGGNEHRAGGTETDIAAAVSHGAGAYRRCGVVPGAGHHNGVRRDAQQGGDLRLYGANFFIAFIEPGHLLLRNAADFQHLFGPALVLHIQKQHPGSVGIIAAVGPCEHIVHIILRQHDLCDFPEVLRLVLPKPQDFRGGEARKGNIIQIVNKFRKFFADIYAFGSCCFGYLVAYGIQDDTGVVS